MAMTTPRTRSTPFTKPRFRRHERPSRATRQHGDLALSVTFWVFSMLFGIGAAIAGWGLAMLVAWLMLAVVAVSVMTRTDREDRLLQ